MTEKAKKWSDEAISTLRGIVGTESPVSAATMEKAALALEVSNRSVASKLRQLDLVVSSLAKEKVSTFTETQSAELATLVHANVGNLTYKELAEQFEAGAFSAKQIQGKLLALELTGSVKAAEKVEVARTYSAQEETTFVSMSQSGKFIEEIAAVLGKTIASVRGKALSLTRNGQIAKIPAQKESHAVAAVDIVVSLGEKLASMTVTEIAKAADKTERGIKTMLTRRGIKVSDYDGASKKLKAEAKTQVAA